MKPQDLAETIAQVTNLHILKAYRSDGLTKAEARTIDQWLSDLGADLAKMVLEESDPPWAASVDEARIRLLGSLDKIEAATESVPSDEPATTGPSSPNTGPEEAEPGDGGPGEETSDFDPQDDDHPGDQAGLVNGEPLGSIKHPEPLKKPAKAKKRPAEESEDELDTSEVRKRARQAIDGGVTRTKLAEVCGVSEPTIPNLLDPMSKPWAKTLQKVSDGLSRIGY